MSFRGSRKHILDWTSRPADIFAAELSMLVQPCGATVTSNDFWMPRGHQETDEAKLDAPDVPLLGPTQKCQLQSWWLKHTRRANVPNWDLVSTCIMGDQRKGLILIEAKAHSNELKCAGKPLSEKCSDHSEENHEHIGLAIDKACESLRKIVPGVNICRDKHYQLANRVATSWFLASELGIPTILVYMGFLGDTNMSDQGKPFFRDEDWQSAFRSHAQGILPDTFCERMIPCGDAPMWLLVRSLAIVPSPHD